MRTLPSDEVKHYYSLQWRLLAYVNRTFELVDGLKNLSDWQKGGVDVEMAAKIRDKLYVSDRIIRKYQTDNPDKLSNEDREIIGSWRCFVRSDFYIVSHLKHYAVFLAGYENPMAYGVKGLVDDFDVVAGGFPLPIQVNAVLLPWKGEIIHDGIMSVQPIIFGRGISGDISRAYQRAKALHGVIVSLPFVKNAPDHEAVLRSYLKTERMYEEYAEEVHDLLEKEPSLISVYQYERSRAAVTRLRRELRQRGIEHGSFAVYKLMIVAGTETESACRRAAQTIVPDYDHDSVYYFTLKSKRRDTESR